MSKASIRSRFPPWVAAASLLLCLASTTAAQSAEAYRTRVERLEGRLRQIRQERGQSGEGDTLPGDLDTLRVGPIRLLAPAAAGSFVRIVAARLHDSLEVVVRGDTDYLPSVTYFVRPSGRGARAPRFEGVRTWGYQAADAPGRERDTPENVASNLLGTLRQDVLLASGPTVHWWLDRSQVPLDTLTQIQASTVYLELATTPWHAVAACYAGVLAQCRVALAVEAGGPEAWYTPDERRQLVGWGMKARADVQRDIRAQRCVNGGDQGACLEMLGAYPALADEPLSPMARQTLLRVAFQAGGEGTFGRFMRGDSLALQDRLASTAGLPIDSLIARWHAAILAGRPKGAVLSRLGGWTAFLWVVALTVAAMRSTRWRAR